MGTRYTATVTLHCWKQHTCVGCGSNYRYQFKRKKSGQGGTQGAAHAAVEQAVVSALANEVDMQPCPGCGLYQPDMIGVQRSKQHWWLVGIAGVILLILFILAATWVVPYPTVARIATAACGLLLVGHLIVDRNDPNRSQGANQRKAQQMAERGQIELCTTGQKDPAAVEKPRAKSSAGLILCGIYALGIVGMGAAEMLRTAGGWTFNKQCYPGVVGPGDHTRIYFSKTFQSLAGYWVGQARVEVLNAQELGLQTNQLTAQSNTKEWGKTISVKQGQENSTVRPWADIQFPRSVNLTDKEVKLRITLNVNYPKIQRGDTFAVEPDTLTQEGSVQLSKLDSGSQYISTYWLGMLGGTAAVIVAGLMLSYQAHALRRQALPTSVTPVGETSAPPVNEAPTWAQDQDARGQFRADKR